MKKFEIILNIKIIIHTKASEILYYRYPTLFNINDCLLKCNMEYQMYKDDVSFNQL